MSPARREKGHGGAARGSGGVCVRCSLLLHGGWPEEHGRQGMFVCVRASERSDCVCVSLLQVPLLHSHVRCVQVKGVRPVTGPSSLLRHTEIYGEASNYSVKLNSYGPEEKTSKPLRGALHLSHMVLNSALCHKSICLCQITHVFADSFHIVGIFQESSHLCSRRSLHHHIHLYLTLQGVKHKTRC